MEHQRTIETGAKAKSENGLVAMIVEHAHPHEKLFKTFAHEKLAKVFSHRFFVDSGALFAFVIR